MRYNPEGEDWWEEPQNLREQLLFKRVLEDPMKPLPGETMIRRGNHNWTKWEWIHRSPGGWKTVVHFWKTPGGMRVEPKFKYVSPAKARDYRPVRSDEPDPIEYQIETQDYPLNMREKLVYEIVMSGEAPENETQVSFSAVTKEPFISLYKQGWRKWQHRHVSRAGRLTIVNFWMNKRGERIFPKFVREARPYDSDTHFYRYNPDEQYHQAELRYANQPSAENLAQLNTLRIRTGQEPLAPRDFFYGLVYELIDIVEATEKIAGYNPIYRRWWINGVYDRYPVYIGAYFNQGSCFPDECNEFSNFILTIGSFNASSLNREQFALGDTLDCRDLRQEIAESLALSDTAYGHGDIRAAREYAEHVQNLDQELRTKGTTLGVELDFYIANPTLYITTCHDGVKNSLQLPMHQPWIYEPHALLQYLISLLS